VTSEWTRKPAAGSRPSPNPVDTTLATVGRLAYPRKGGSVDGRSPGWPHRRGGVKRGDEPPAGGWVNQRFWVNVSERSQLRAPLRQGCALKG